MFSDNFSNDTSNSPDNDNAPAENPLHFIIGGSGGSKPQSIINIISIFDKYLAQEFTNATESKAPIAVIETRNHDDFVTACEVIFDGDDQLIQDLIVANSHSKDQSEKFILAAELAKHAHLVETQIGPELIKFLNYSESGIYPQELQDLLNKISSALGNSAILALRAKDALYHKDSSGHIADVIINSNNIIYLYDTKTAIRALENLLQKGLIDQKTAENIFDSITKQASLRGLLDVSSASTAIA